MGLGGSVVCHSENKFSRWPTAEFPTAHCLSSEPIPFTENKVINEKLMCQLMAIHVKSKICDDAHCFYAYS